MDFAFSETQTAVADLAKKIFEQRLTPAALKAVDADPAHFDRKTWRELATTGLLGTAIPETYGGSGQGLMELFALMQEAGAAVAPMPLWATLVLGALPILEFGNDEQKKRLLPRVATGEAFLTAALAEPDSDAPTRLATSARADGASWKLTGVKTCVPAASIAERILVPATTGAGKIGMFLVSPTATGVTLTPQITTTGEVQFRVVLDGATVEAADVLGETSGGAAILDWLIARATVALCAMELGVAERALRMTASYTTTREQFERPIATFQAVSQRAADAYVDVEAVRVATWQAAWQLSAGLAANEAVSTAKYFAAYSGHRVVFAAQHLHGGMGFDLEYPLHRYYLWSKQIELTLGSGSVHLAKLGHALAAE
jgi:alkylation response protein AidB-like acyl-CoA dehydrogenase